jgi:DNA adenine methylase
MESIRKIATRPISPAAPYIGGKRNLAKLITKLIDSIDHEAYAEPFVGMGGIFFRRTSRPSAEFINDYSRDVATFFRILQRHYTPFMDILRFQLTTRADFDRLMKVDPDTLTDLERAARFLYLQRTSFGGKVNGRNFGVSYGRPARFDVTRLEPMLAEIYERLAPVNIECLPFETFITRYDRPGTLFFIDPPYWDCEDDYGKNVFSKTSFEALRGLLDTLKGRFILTINDVPETRELFKAFKFEPVKLTYSVGTGQTEGRELIVTKA